MKLGSESPAGLSFLFKIVSTLLGPLSISIFFKGCFLKNKAFSFKKLTHLYIWFHQAIILTHCSISGAYCTHLLYSKSSINTWTNKSVKEWINKPQKSYTDHHCSYPLSSSLREGPQLKDLASAFDTQDSSINAW